MPDSPETVIYQFRVALVGISPLIWRRLLVCGDATVADFHHILQIAFGWSDSHLHQFLIHAKRYGISRSGGTAFMDDPREIKLSDFGLRVSERVSLRVRLWRSLATPHPSRSDPSTSAMQVLSHVHRRQTIRAAGGLRRCAAVLRASATTLTFLSLTTSGRDYRRRGCRPHRETS